MADTHLTETGALADLLLPMATYLESWNLESRPAMELVPFVSIRQPLVAPLGQSLSLGDAFAGLARRMGEDVQKAFPYAGSEECIARAAARIDGLSRNGGIDLLKKEGVWFDPAAKPEYRSYEKKGLSHPIRESMRSSPRSSRRGGFPPFPPMSPSRPTSGGRRKS